MIRGRVAVAVVPVHVVGSARAVRELPDAWAAAGAAGLVAADRNWIGRTEAGITVSIGGGAHHLVLSSKGCRCRITDGEPVQVGPLVPGEAQVADPLTDLLAGEGIQDGEAAIVAEITRVIPTGDGSEVLCGPGASRGRTVSICRDEDHI